MRSPQMIVAAVVAPHPFQLRIGAETTMAPEVTNRSAATRLRHIMTKVSTVLGEGMCVFASIIEFTLPHSVDIDSRLTRISQRRSSRAAQVKDVATPALARSSALTWIVTMANPASLVHLKSAMSSAMHSPGAFLSVF